MGKPPFISFCAFALCIFYSQHLVVPLITYRWLISFTEGSLLVFRLMASLYLHVWFWGLTKLGPGSDICRELKIVPLLLFCIERIRLWWFRHLTRMPPGCLPLEVFGLGRDHLTQKAPEGLYGSHLAWESHRVLQEELDSVAGQRDVWNSPLSMLSPWPHLGIEMDGCLDGRT